METTTTNSPAKLNGNSPESIIDKSLVIFKDAGRILTANNDRTEKAMSIGRKILSDIQANGGKMTPELDARCNKYLANINVAVKEMNDLRSPVTQIMDALKKMYTELENKLDIKKPETIPAQIHGKRNEYVKQVYEEQERQRVEAERKTRIEQQRVELAAWIQTTINNKLIYFLQEKKLKMTNSFNAITLELFEQKSAALKNMAIEFPDNKCAEIISYQIPISNFSLLDDIMMNTVRTDAHTSFDFKGFYAQYEREVGELKQQLIDRLPSKKIELEEIMNAGVAEKKRLQEEAERRKQLEDDRIKREAEQSRQKAEKEAESQKLAGSTMAMFNQAASLNNTPAPEARQGYDIIVTHQAGYVEIFQFWFTNEGVKSTIDEIGKKTLNQMKKWCEDAAHKYDQRIISKYLKYEPRYTAVNRKEKVAQ